MQGGKGVYLQEVGGHDEGRAGAQLAHGLEAKRHDLGPRAVVHKGVYQLTQHRRQHVRWHQVVACLQRVTNISGTTSWKFLEVSCRKLLYKSQ